MKQLALAQANGTHQLALALKFASHTDMLSSLQVSRVSLSICTTVLLQKLVAAIGSTCIVFDVQVWRPLIGPVQDSALGFVDAATLSQHDILPANLFLTEEFAIEVNYIVHNPSHR